MCGLAGFIGQSKKPKLSYELITNIFKNLEIRGTDASGVWGTETGQDGNVYYHKSPILSSDFVETEFWKNLKKVRLDMLLVHARAASKGGGDPKNNSNNHPFISDDHKIGMVHNGNIDEARFLKNKYETYSETDSELLLRIFEHGLYKEFISVKEIPDDLNQRITGIKDIWSYVSSGAMAVAIGERFDDSTRGLFLFRNNKRPLWLADLRNLMGQVFFFSSPEIWYKAISENPSLKKCCWATQKLIEVPCDQIWYLQIDKDMPVVTDETLFKFRLTTRFSGKEFEVGPYCPIKPSLTELSVISHIEEEIEEETESTFQSRDIESQYDIDSDLYDIAPRDDHFKMCEDMKHLIDEILLNINNSCIEDEKFTHSYDYEQTIESLKQTHCDLKGTLRILQS